MNKDNHNPSDNTTAAVKPLLRGWFHAAAALGSIVLTVLLCWFSRDEWPKLLAMLVFGITMIEMFTVSAVYHIGRWREAAYRVLSSLDHANIFLLIAGTYTPVGLIMLTGWVRVALLVAIWACAAVGVWVAVFARQVPRGIRTMMYIAMGWVAMLAIPALLNVLPPAAMALLIFGGVLHTVGALIYALKKPNPFPRVLGFHEIFHLFVIAGSAAFTAVIAFWVLPYSPM